MLAIFALVVVSEYQAETSLRQVLATLQQPVPRSAWAPPLVALTAGLGILLPVLPLFALSSNDPRWSWRPIQALLLAVWASHAVLLFVVLPSFKVLQREPNWFWPVFWLAMLALLVVMPERWRSRLGPRPHE
jgi:hypothetical protein